MTVQNNWDNLQALRGLACLGVVGIHLAVWETTFGMARPPLHVMKWFGYAGVDLFFVLSGFIITYTQSRHWGQSGQLPQYLFRRAWRIFPTYWILLAIGTLLFVYALNDPPPIPDPGFWPRWLAWVFLLPSESPNIYLITAWTLPYELLFYAVFGVLLILPRRFAPTILALWAIGVLIFGSIVTANDPAVSRYWHWFFSPYVLEFLLGCVVAKWITHQATRLATPALIGGILWMTAGILIFNTRAMPYELGNHPWQRVLTFGPGCALLIYAFTTLERHRAWTFPRWLRHIGDASYSIYLWHVPVGITVYSYTLTWDHQMLPHMAWLSMMLTVCVGGGYLFHRLVEKPLLNLTKQRRGDHTTESQVLNTVVQIKPYNAPPREASSSTRLETTGSSSSGGAM